MAPVDAARVRPTENANAVAVEQVKVLLARVSERGDDSLFVFDTGYDPVQLQRGLEEGCGGAQILVRLQAERCFYADPEGPPGPSGRPQRHGRKMDTKDLKTCPEPSAEHRSEDSGYRWVRVRSWARLHPKTQEHPTRGTRRPRPIVRGRLVLVEVSRLPRLTRQPRMLWLWWSGSGKANLDLLWRAYVRRFDLEHVFRFLKRNSVGPRLECATPSRLTCGRG